MTGRKPALTARVLRGLSLLVEHADAGGPDDLEIDEDSSEGNKDYADVKRAIEFVRAMREWKTKVKS